MDNAYVSKYTGDQIDKSIKEIQTLAEDILNIKKNIIGTEIKNEINDLKKERKLPLSGGEMTNTAQIQTSRTGDEYTNVQNAALIRFTESTDHAKYSPIYSCKVTNGFFSCGVDHGSEGVLVWRFNDLNNQNFELARLTSQGQFTTKGTYNDIAEFRQSNEQEPGRVVCECGDGKLTRAIKRLQPGAEIYSDTCGYIIGQDIDSYIPIAICGRVLAYPYESYDQYKPGDPVCSGPNGTISKMSREEVKEYPDRIIGTVSEIPNYDNWGNIKVNGRIWIRIK